MTTPAFVFAANAAAAVNFAHDHGWTLTRRDAVEFLTPDGERVRYVGPNMEDRLRGAGMAGDEIPVYAAHGFHAVTDCDYVRHAIQCGMLRMKLTALDTLP